MNIRRQSLVSSLVLAAALILAPLQQSHALTADEMFAEGNRLSRDDLYWAALLRYEQALEAGMNSAVLYYNIGVTHYKAGQHERAREVLDKLDDLGLADRTIVAFTADHGEELLDRAEAGELGKPEVLAAQFDRMLKDQKLKRFCDSFPSQWLQLERIISSVPMSR